MKKEMLKIAASVLTASLLFTGLPAQIVDQKASVETVCAAVAKPTNVKLSVKRVSSSKVKVSASWSGSAPAYMFELYYEDGYGGHGSAGGVQYDTSFSYTFKHPEGEMRTYGIKVKGIAGNDGPYSAQVKKTKNFMNTGTYTKKIKNLVKSNTSGMSDYEKVRFAHDWLIKNVDYDQTYDMEKSTTLAGTMKYKKAVCQGYSIAFGVFMKEMKIPSKYVVSTNGDHMWNLVKLGGKWYHVDVTWDDPMGMESVTIDHPIYDYFLQSTGNFQAKDPSADHIFKTKSVPTANSTIYDNPGSTDNYYEAVPGD
nr:hypothetical protein [Lachnospiraceae bacterium]